MRNEELRWVAKRTQAFTLLTMFILADGGSAFSFGKTDEPRWCPTSSDLFQNGCAVTLHVISFLITLHVIAVRK